MQKKAIAIVVMIAIVFGGMGCMDRNASVKKEELYLAEKYNRNFSYVSEGNDVWTSTSITSIYADDIGNSFSVEDTDGMFVDNYGSVMYDEQIEEVFQESVGSDYQLYVSTRSAFFGKDDVFKDCRDYALQCPVLNIAVYYVEGDAEQCAAHVVDAIEDVTALLVTYQVSHETFEQMKADGNRPDMSEVIMSKSFQIKNGTLA